jgi:nucleoside-diphosphate-sugar epimerase
MNLIRYISSQIPTPRLYALCRPSSGVIPGAKGLIEVCPVNLSDSAEVGRIVRAIRPDIVVHCAAIGLTTRANDWSELVETNIRIAVNVVEAASMSPGCHLIHISTGLVYRDLGRPLTERDPIGNTHPYAATKGAADLLVQATAEELGQRVTIVRPFSFTGPGEHPDRLFSSLLRGAATRIPVKLTDGTQIRDHCSLEDIVSGIYQIMMSPRPPSGGTLVEVFNFGSGKLSSLKEMITDVIEQLHLDVELHFGGRPSDLRAQRFLVANIDKAKNVLGWKPVYTLSYAVWALAKEIAPELTLVEPSMKYE